MARLVLRFSLTFWLFYFLGLVSSAFAEEEFYILPFGQGSGQLIIYNANDPDHKVGVLYDLGSKSLQMHPKFLLRGDWEQKFKKISEESHFAATLLVAEESTPVKQRLSLTVGATPQTTERKVGATQSRKIKTSLQKFTKELLSDLKYLFVFISHTDIDHINLLDNDTIPEKLPLMVFLCGDWFGDVCAQSEDAALTSRAVKSVLSFLGTRPHTHVEFPYYWGFNPQGQNFNDFARSKLSTLDHADIEIVLSELAIITSKTNYESPCPRFFSGSFMEMLGLFMPSFKGFVESDPNLLSAAINIDVWSLNLPVSDVNDFSPVISCILPSINLSVVLTGDAGVPVFQSVTGIRGYSPTHDYKNIKGLDSSHLVLLMLPHHGSWKNISGEMLRFFKPSIFGIAAGDGGQHGHPSLRSVKWIEHIALQKELQIPFMCRYEGVDSYSIITIDEQARSPTVKYPHKVLKMQAPSPLFLCPNIYGCIKWDQEGIHTNSSNVITINDVDHYLDNAAHTLEMQGDIRTDTIECVEVGDTGKTTVLHYKQLLDKEFYPYTCLLTDPSTSKIYAALPVEDKTFFYELVASNN